MPSGPTDRDGVFRKVVESASCVIVILRADHKIAYFSPYAARLTGYSGSDVVEQDGLRLFLPEDEHEGVAAEIRRVLAGGAPRESYERAILCRNGERRWLLWKAQRLGEFDGYPALLAIGHDVTESRHAHEALLDREAHLQALLDTAVDGIITIDEHGAIQSVNAAAERIFGYAAGRDVGKQCVDAHAVSVPRAAR